MLQLFSKRLFIAAVLLLGSAGGAWAQGWIGLANSNYAGTNNVYINPSSIADSRQKFYIGLVGADINVYNTYLQLDMPYSPWQVVRGQVGPQYRDASNKVVFQTDYLREQLGNGNKFGSVSAELRLPSFMVSLGPKHSIAFSNRARSFVQVSNVSENLARLARYGLAEAERLGLANKLLDDNSFNIGVNNYHEFALTYARTFTPNTTHFFKGGLTLKYLVGLGGGYLLNEGINYQVYNGDSIQLQNRNVSYGYTDYSYYDRADFKISDLYGSKRLGQGFGADLGLTYEWRPEADKYQYRMDNADWTDNSENKYKLKAGLAISDIGAVFYNNSQYVRQAQLANTRTIQWGQLDTLKYTSLNASVDQTLAKIVGLSGQTTQFTSYLPTALHLTADYQVRKHLYAGLLWTQNLLPATTIGSRAISSLAVTPRVEFSQAEFSMPLVLANNYRKFQVGAMLRLGPVFVGSDNLGGVFGVTTTTGYDLYAGLGFALGKKKHKDRDGDRVSDQLDKCPTIKGAWEFKGCPDRDGDHIQDSEDDCPDLAGIAEFKGCPDRDGDHVPDKADDCPDVPGVVALRGCPDRDGDGVKDSDDKCPDMPGPVEHFGCPDTDQDGLYDNEDGCPTVAGPVENKGCPWGDQDQDTVFDKDDACPTVAGPVENKGCPWADTDGDTVLDKDDDCPLTPGPVENKGCPVIAKAEQKVLNTAFANLEFQTNKDVILRSSYPSLNELAKLLRAKPEFRLRLSGYTDNVGTPQYNLVLSRKRAEAVKRYLAKADAPAENIRTEYFGRSKPVATNKTAAGRARNRRVEMKVLFD
jgi:outer membrane protein OmpA-like peptidoglycan-associated protein